MQQFQAEIKKILQKAYTPIHARDMGVERGKERRTRTEADTLSENLADLKGFDGVHLLTDPPHFFSATLLSHSLLLSLLSLLGDLLQRAVSFIFREKQI